MFIFHFTKKKKTERRTDFTKFVAENFWPV